MAFGRKPIEIDWRKVEQLLEAGCKGTEIAAFLGINIDTLYDRVKQTFNVDFSVYSLKFKSKGDSLLRAKQFETAMKGDKTMQIWLGKQRLGQKEKTDITTNDKEITQKIFVLSQDAVNEINRLKDAEN